MEILTQQRLAGGELRARIIEEYGSREALETLAKDGSERAADDLMTIESFEEDPNRLAYTYTVTLLTHKRRAEILLTTQRLRLLRAVTKAAKKDKPLGINQLARGLGRDKKNVSREVAKLAALGLVRKEREGARQLVFPAGNTVSFTLDD